MPMITLEGRGRVTIPSALRRELQINPGDVLDASIEKGRLVMTPREGLDRKEAVRRVKAVFRGIRVAQEDIGKSEKEIMEEVIREVDAMREEKKAKSTV